jgi:hypothetical protein
MLPTPCLNPFDVYFAVVVARDRSPPFQLTRPLARHPAFRFQTEVLMPTVSPWPEPNPAMAALPEPICTHSLSPILDREEYGTVLAAHTSNIESASLRYVREEGRR